MARVLLVTHWSEHSNPLRTWIEYKVAVNVEISQMRFNKIKYIAAGLVAIAGFGLQQAKADTFSFNLSVGNPAISGYPGPYVSVNVNRTNSTHATITSPP